MAGSLPSSDTRGTPLRIIEAAEWLFAMRGLSSVSLREIGAAAGCNNVSAVRYHFGTKDQLITAIFRLRLGEMEVKRQELLSLLKIDNATSDIRRILEAIYLPLAQQRDSVGRRSYAAFISGLQRFGDISARSLLDSFEAPVIAELALLLQQALPPLPDLVRRRRLRMAIFLVCDTLIWLDTDPAATEPEPAALADMFDVVVAALCAPLTAR